MKMCGGRIDLARFLTTAMLGIVASGAFSWHAVAQSALQPTIDPMTPPVLAQMLQRNSFRASFGINGDLLLRIVDEQRVWDERTKSLMVCFAADASRDDRAKFVAVAAAWEERRPNLFDFGTAPNYQTCSGKHTENIRVAFKREWENGRPKAHWSRLGKQSLDFKTDPSLNINPDALREDVGITFQFAVLHELGHALGMEEEHKHPDIKCYEKIMWDKAELRYGWLRLDQIKAMFAALVGTNYSTTPYDNKSIMHYYLYPDILESGTQSPCYKTMKDRLSDRERDGIVDLYPIDAHVAVSALQSRIARANKMLADVPLTSTQRVRLGQELTSALALGNAGGLNATFKLGPALETGPTISNKFTKEEFKGAGPAPDCTPSSLRGQATCSLGKNGSELRISVH